MENAGAVVRQQIARRRPVAVFIVDLDHFKSINDRFGHALGDRALRVFAQVCKGNLRSTDFFGRVGGEEFAVLLADAARDNAFAVAERIRIAFETAATVVDGEPLTATISIGVAIIQRPDQDLASLLHQADQALYRAKARGRNRVELAPVESEGSVEPPAIPIAQPARVRAPR